MMNLQKGFFSGPRLLAMLLAALVLLLPLMALCEVQPVAYQRDDTARSGLVRVCLASLGSPRTLDFDLKTAYRVADSEIALPAGARVTISTNASNGRITLSCSGRSWNLEGSVVLLRSSKQASLTIRQAQNAGAYYADVTVNAVRSEEGFVLQTIAYMHLEDYLCGVLRYAIANTAPLEALKAQAVAARTYTARAMESNMDKPYDVVDTGEDQIYRGMPEDISVIKPAVEATKGLVLHYGGTYAEPYYSFCNGGQTESVSNAWGGEDLDYLTVRDDPFDQASTTAIAKTMVIDKDLLHGAAPEPLKKLLKEKTVAALTQQGYAATADNTVLVWLENVKLHTAKHPYPSKLYTMMDFSLRAETTTETGGRQLLSLTVMADVFAELEAPLDMSLQPTPNELWSVSATDSSFTLRAARYGHGVGMSQYGAAEMAKQGYACDYILGFYYPGCTAVRLNFSDRILREQLSVPAAAASAGEITALTTPPVTPAVQDTPVSQHTAAPTALPESDPVPVATPEPTPEPTRAPAPELEPVSAAAATEAPALPAAAPAETTAEPAAAFNAATETVSPLQQHSVYAYVIADGFLNLRQSPSMDAPVLTVAFQGEAVQVVGMDGEWAQVQYKGYYAYAVRVLLSEFFTAGETLSAEETPAFEDAAPSVRATVYAEWGRVNFRQQPDKAADVIMKLEPGTVVEVTGQAGSFCSAVYQGISGYIMSEFLIFEEELSPNNETGVVQNDASPSAETPAPLPQATPATVAVLPEVQEATGQAPAYRNARVTTDGGTLNLRETPSDTAAVLLRMPQCAVVQALEFDDTWCAVLYDGISGYAKSAYLTFGENYAPEVIGGQMSIALPEYSMGPAVVTTPSGSLNLRLQPCPYSTVITLLPRGETVEVYAIEGEWALVTYREYAGYVKVAYLEMEQYDQAYEQPVG